MKLFRFLQRDLSCPAIGREGFRSAAEVPFTGSRELTGVSSVRPSSQNRWPKPGRKIPELAWLEESHNPVLSGERFSGGSVYRIGAAVHTER